MEIEETARQSVDDAMKVRKALGAGLLESAYQVCLALEVISRARCTRDRLGTAESGNWGGCKGDPLEWIR